MAEPLHSFAQFMIERPSTLLAVLLLALGAGGQAQQPTVRVVSPPTANPSPAASEPPAATSATAMPGAEMLPPPLQVGGPMSLDQCVNIAQANHPKLAAARANVDQAYGQMVQAGLYPNPRVDNGNPQFIMGGQNSVYNAGLTQTVVRGGKLRLSQGAAREALRQAELDYISARFQLITDVRNQFYIVLAAQERITTLNRLVVILQSTEKTSTHLLDAGRVSESDLLLVRVERRRAESNVRSDVQQLIGARRQLATLMGIPEYQLSAVNGDLKVTIPLLDDMPLGPEVVEQNSQVRRAEVDINRTRLLLSRARAEPIPNLIMQGGFQYTINEPHQQGTLGMYLDVPIFDRNQGNIRAAGAGVREAAANVGVTRLDLFKQVVDAEADYRAASQVVRSYEEGILPDATRGLDLIQRGYEQGLFDIIRVLQSQRSVVEANLDYVQAQQTRLTAAAKLAGLLQLETFP